MKKVIILLIVLITSFESFAQKAKANLDTNKGGTIINTYSCPMHPDEMGDKPSKCSKCGMELALSKKEQMKTAVMKTYTCSKHPNVMSNEPGKCAICGMAMKETKKMAQIYSCPMHPSVVSNNPGLCAKCGKNLALSPKEQMKMEIMKNYTCSKHPKVTSDTPGKCPDCGMTMETKKTIKS